MRSNTPWAKPPLRDHGGNLDAAIARFGGARADWLDLSTGINPAPYPIPDLSPSLWTALPDHSSMNGLEDAARAFWFIPDSADVMAAPGASALIARLPLLATPGVVEITRPTYNEHAAAFEAAGWRVQEDGPADARVCVHPNNPDGRLFDTSDLTAPLCIIDESFCDVVPKESLVAEAARPGIIILKSFGKFWGLAGLRLGFAIAAPETISRLKEMLGPWPVSGPALEIGRRALSDDAWADATRLRLSKDRARLDRRLQSAGAEVVGGTDLFGLYRVSDAQSWQDRLARSHIWSRVFPYADDLLRLGLPAPDRWGQLEAAL